MRLKEWTDDQRQDFNRSRAQQYSIKDAHAKLAALHEDLHVYPYVTVHKYTLSDQGKAELEEAYNELRTEVKTEAFSHRGSRVFALIEIANKLLERFRTGLENRDLVLLGREFREMMKAIREEVDPYGIADGVVISHFDKLLAGYADLPEADRKVIMDGTEWQPPHSTNETN